MNRAYAILDVKRLDNGARVVEGIATTPMPDRFKTCSKCRKDKPNSEFGTTRTVGGVAIPRAECRACYNRNRRAHYARPEVKAVKKAKRRMYEAGIGLADKRKKLRSDPAFKAKEKMARDLYRSRPDVQAMLAESRASYKQRVDARSHMLFESARSRAKKRGLKFDLTEEWVLHRVRLGYCQETRIPFDMGKPPEGCNYNPYSPSIDQIRPGQGYTRNNCRLVITALNTALGRWGDDTYETVATAWLRARGFSVEKRGD